MEKSKAEENDVKDAEQKKDTAKSQGKDQKKNSKSESSKSKGSGKSGSNGKKGASSSQTKAEKKKLTREEEIILEFKDLRKNLLGINH